MILAWLSFVGGLLAISLALLGPLCAHFGIMASLRGFSIFLSGLALGVLALLLGAIALWMLRSDQVPLRRRAIIGTAIGASLTVLFGVLVSRSRGYPPINDITTDIDYPPEFTMAGELPANRGRDMKYDKSKYADQQKLGYPDLGGLPMQGQPTDIFEKAKAVAEQMPQWELTRVDPGTLTIEGVATSGMFRFQDDFVIRLNVQGAQSVVQMRSKSRDGVGDVGANANRIHAYFNKLTGETEG